MHFLVQANLIPSHSIKEWPENFYRDTHSLYKPHLTWFKQCPQDFYRDTHSLYKPNPTWFQGFFLLRHSFLVQAKSKLIPSFFSSHNPFFIHLLLQLTWGGWHKPYPFFPSHSSFLSWWLTGGWHSPCTTTTPPTKVADNKSFHTPSLSHYLALPNPIYIPWCYIP